MSILCRFQLMCLDKLVNGSGIRLLPIIAVVGLGVERLVIPWSEWLAVWMEASMTVRTKVLVVMRSKRLAVLWSER